MPHESLSPDEISTMSYPDLLSHREHLNSLLSHLPPPQPPPSTQSSKRKKPTTNTPPSSSSSPSPTGIPYTPKIDTHWDYVLKEMMWLSADFQSERKRQLSSAKKLSFAVKQFHRTKESRRLQKLAEQVAKKRRLASKLARDVTRWWSKIDKIISYKQKVLADVSRKKEMDRHLVFLVKQTERYSRELNRKKGEGGRTIEEVLTGVRRRSVVDYTKMKVEEEFYGESVLEKSDEEFVPGSSELEDDYTTLMEEERMANRDDDGDDDDDEDENRKRDEIHTLKKESKMDVQDVLLANYDFPERQQDTKRVTFAANQPQQPPQSACPSSPSEPTIHTSSLEQDDTMTAESDQEEEEEFSPNDVNEVDDETTIEAEEKLGRDVSYEEELDLLRNENEMPIEELRALYAKMEEQQSAQQQIEDQEDEDDEEEDDDDDKEEQQQHKQQQQQEEKTSPTPNSSLSAITQDVDVDDHAEEDEFHPDLMEHDDETTMQQEETLGRDMSYEDEINLLKRESEMSVEELRAMYASMDDDASELHAAKRIKLEGKEEEEEEVEAKEDDEQEENEEEEEVEQEENEEEEEEKQEQQIDNEEDGEEETTHKLVTKPFLLSSWVHLRAYQQIGLNWLVSIQTRRLNGILADEMGLGKTLQTIALLAYLAAYKGIWGPHLVIVPTSCIVNWEMELKRFCPAFKVLCYYGSAKRRKELRQGWTKTNWHHVIITSYQLAVQDSFAFKRKRWYYLILDEAHNIKNFQSQRWQTLVNFNTQRRLLLTGTPLQNNLMELWSLLHFLMPHVFRSRKEFSYWFSNPMNNIIEGNVNRNDDLILRLHGIIRPFVLRRLKKDVETQMPGKFEHIVKCQLSRRQMFLYEEFMARSSTRVALSEGGNFMGMMNVLMQLRKVCNHPDLFEPRSVITPFVMDVPLCLVTAGCCLVNVREKEDVLEGVSRTWIHPVWSAGCGISSYDAALSHDSIKVDQLCRYGTPPEIVLGSAEGKCIRESEPGSVDKPHLTPLLTKIYDKAKREATLITHLHSEINTRRCRHSSPFPYPRRTIDAVTISLLPNFNPPSSDGSPYEPHIASTPKELFQMRKSQQQRADEMDDLLQKFVFCVPKAGAKKPILSCSKIDHDSTLLESRLSSQLSTHLDTHFYPYRRAHARLTSFFPDKTLIQFDAGKLQTLSTLLRTLKQSHHRVLIFTQMSKMLDILESFLNLNGHTYLRLDGSTSVDSRQRLMDRFNNDDKVFCFILSTRSGGLGVNLTGADTVIFYDSDWNPAMDAQAQDRAHRIGQTRDVHIYRLVTEHSIEENILIKAKQKRQLDFLVMDQGQFTNQQEEEEEEDGGGGEGQEVFTKGGLRDILGIQSSTAAAAAVSSSLPERKKEEPEMSQEQMENAMASLEDEDDVMAMRGAQKEAADELQEFDETVQLKNNDDDAISQASRDDDDDDNNNDDNDNDEESVLSKTPKKKQKKTDADSVTSKQHDDDNDAEMEKEFAAWQSTVGIDMSVIEKSLKPTERYGLQFREQIDPFYSVFYLAEQQQKKDATALEDEDEWDVDEIEALKEEEEQRAMDDGDLLATNPTIELLPRHRQLYLRERTRIRSEKMRRKLTGENWTMKTDGITQLPFYYNEDTGEAVWDKPSVLLQLEEHKLAILQTWNALPAKPAHRIMTFLIPHPDRANCACVCRQWRHAATDIDFVKHVFPVEMGAFVMDQTKLAENHFANIDDALRKALPGDTIELGDGHYWVNDGMVVDCPLKIVGDEHDPSHVVLELSGSVVWRGGGGWMEGCTVRRPGMAKGGMEGEEEEEVLRVENGGRFDMAHCVLDNEGSCGSVVLLKGGKSRGKWEDVVIKGAGKNGCGVMLEDEANLELVKCHIANNGGTGIICKDKSTISLSDCYVEENKGMGITLQHESHGYLTNSRIIHNKEGVMSMDKTCNLTSTMKIQ